MKDWTGLLRLLSLGWIIILSIGIGFFLGFQLDNLLHTLPLFTLIGLLLGVVGAFVGVYRLVSSTVEEQREPKQK